MKAERGIGLEKKSKRAERWRNEENAEPEKGEGLGTLRGSFRVRPRTKERERARE